MGFEWSRNGDILPSYSNSCMHVLAVLGLSLQSRDKAPLSQYGHRAPSPMSHSQATLLFSFIRAKVPRRAMSAGNEAIEELKVVGGEREIVCLKFVDTIVFGRVSSEYPVHLKTTKSLVFLPSRSSFPYEICLVQLAGGRSRSLYCCHYSQMSIIVDGKRGTKKLFFAASIFLAVHALRSSKEDLGSR